MNDLQNKINKKGAVIVKNKKGELNMSKKMQTKKDLEKSDNRIALASKIIADLGRQGYTYGEILRIATMIDIVISRKQRDMLKELPKI